MREDLLDALKSQKRKAAVHEVLPHMTDDEIALIDEVIASNVVDLDGLKEDHSIAKDFIEKSVSGQSKCVIPTFFVKCFDPKTRQKVMAVVPVMSDFNEEQEKNAVIAQIAKEVFGKRLVPISVTIMTEAWMAKVSKDEVDDSGHCESRIRDRDDKKEVAFIASQTPEGLMVVSTGGITRNSSQNIFVSEFEVQYEGKAESPSIVTRFFAEYGRLGMAMMSDIVARNSRNDDEDIDLEDMANDL